MKAKVIQKYCEIEATEYADWNVDNFHKRGGKLHIINSVKESTKELDKNMKEYERVGYVKYNRTGKA